MYSVEHSIPMKCFSRSDLVDVIWSVPPTKVPVSGKVKKSFVKSRAQAKDIIFLFSLICILWVARGGIVGKR